VLLWAFKVEFALTSYAGSLGNRVERKNIAAIIFFRTTHSQAKTHGDACGGGLHLHIRLNEILHL
jgi:hypothetical protein